MMLADRSFRNSVKCIGFMEKGSVSIMERQHNFQMSGTINYYDKVFRCPHNRSKAKVLYSFSKADRFGPQKKFLCDKMYNIPTTIQKRTTSFGYGSKSDFTKNAQKTPSPNNYILKSAFQQGKQNKRGFGFGKGREEMQNTGPLAIVRNNKNPGPGKYPHKSTLCKSSYSFAGSHALENKEQKLIPGPGNYQTPFPFDPTGRYFLSKFKSSRAASFSADHGKRFSNKVNRIPGPGSYKLDLRQGGPEFISKFKTCVAQSFPHSPRKTSMSQKPGTPGPGFYEMPTQFGSQCQGSNKENMVSSIL